MVSFPVPLLVSRQRIVFGGGSGLKIYQGKCFGRVVLQVARDMCGSHGCCRWLFFLSRLGIGVQAFSGRPKQRGQSRRLKDKDTGIGAGVRVGWRWQAKFKFKVRLEWSSG